VPGAPRIPALTIGDSGLVPVGASTSRRDERPQPVLLALGASGTL